MEDKLEEDLWKGKIDSRIIAAQLESRLPQFERYLSELEAAKNISPEIWYMKFRV